MNSIHPIEADPIEIVRAKYLKTISKWDIQQSRLFCEPYLVRFDAMNTEQRDRFIAKEVMGWGISKTDTEFYITQGESIRVDSFKPSQEISSAFRVFEYTLIEDKTTIVPCGSNHGIFWAVYYDDTYIAAGKSTEMAICKAAIVINDAVVAKMNAA